jgi:hypothetical protein
MLRAQIDSLKSSPVVTNEPECIDCSTLFGKLTMLKEKYASKVEELDVLRVQLDEMKSRPSLLGACTLRTMCGSRIGGWLLPCVMSD